MKSNISRLFEMQDVSKVTICLVQIILLYRESWSHGNAVNWYWVDAWFESRPRLRFFMVFLSNTGKLPGYYIH
jgi:hypothetical protein